jgi:hypothetical protein
MGYVIRDGKIQKAKKVTLTPAQRKEVFSQTTKQKEILEGAKKRRELRA